MNRLDILLTDEMPPLRPPTQLRFSLIGLLLIIGQLFFPLLSVNAEIVLEENVVKSAFVIKFARYAEIIGPRQEDPHINYVICSWKDDQFVDVATPLSGKDIFGASARIKRIDSISEIPRCHLLYISKESGEAAKSIIDFAISSKALTVTDTPGLGAINFIVEGDRVKFDCNLTIARNSSFQISSQLIKLATNVIGEQR